MALHNLRKSDGEPGNGYTQCRTRASATSAGGWAEHHGSFFGTFWYLGKAESNPPEGFTAVTHAQVAQLVRAFA